MIRSLGAALQDAQRALVLVGGFRDHFEQIGLAHVMGAGAGDEHTAGSEQRDGAPVDLLIGAAGGVHVSAGLGEGGRIEHHGVELMARSRKPGEGFEGVVLPELDVVDAVGVGVGLRGLEGGFARIDGFDAFAGARPSAGRSRRWR